MYGIQQAELYQNWEIRENSNVFVCFLKWIQRIKGKANYASTTANWIVFTGWVAWTIVTGIEYL